MGVVYYCDTVIPTKVYSAAHKAARTLKKSPRSAKRMAAEARNKSPG
jgi:hypothetical protein